MSTMNEGRATKASVEVAKANYRRLLAEQRKLPASEQWKMGEAIRHAKACVIVEIEELNNGIKWSNR